MEALYTRFFAEAPFEFPSRDGAAPISSLTDLEMNQVNAAVMDRPKTR